MKKWFNFASGWVKKSQGGSEYISAVANGEKATIKLFAELEDGSKHALDSFVVMFNDVAQKKHEKSPDVRFSFTVDESQ
jgi:uncharacterized protein (DUF736 family)